MFKEVLEKYLVSDGNSNFPEEVNKVELHFRGIKNGTQVLHSKHILEINKNKDSPAVLETILQMLYKIKYSSKIIPNDFFGREPKISPSIRSSKVFVDIEAEDDYVDRIYYSLFFAREAIHNYKKDLESKL